MSTKFDWTDAAVGHLRRRRAKGATAREIAGELGCSRGAVLGMAHRLDLPQQEPPGRRPRRATVLDRGAVRSRIRPAARVEVALLDDVLAMRPSEGVVLWELGRTQCRWPLAAGAPWAFCGEPAAPKKAYCAEHAARVYVPLKRG